MIEKTSSGSVRKILGFCAGFAALEAFNKIFDFVAYPIGLTAFGTFYGGMIMTGLSIAISIGQLYLINWRDKNPFKLIQDLDQDAAKIRQEINESRFLSKIALWILWKAGRGFIWLLKKSWLASFIVLSAWRDPFQTMVFVLYSRDGGTKNPMKIKDWLLFAASAVIGNLVLILGWEVVLVPIKYAISVLSGNVQQ